MTTDRQRELSDELLRIEFEFFKHMATLSGAAVVGVVAIYGGFETDRLTVTTALLTFAAAALVSVWGMWLICYQLSLVAQGKVQYRGLQWAVFLVYGLFGSGLVSFVLNTVVSPWLRLILGFAVAAIIGAVVVVKFMRDRKNPDPHNRNLRGEEDG